MENKSIFDVPAEIKNVFIRHLREIVAVSYAGGDKPKWDWSTSIAMYLHEHAIAKELTRAEFNAQYSEFLEYVSTRKFDKDGNEI